MSVCLFVLLFGFWPRKEFAICQCRIRANFIGFLSAFWLGFFTAYSGETAANGVENARLGVSRTLGKNHIFHLHFLGECLQLFFAANPAAIRN